MQAEIFVFEYVFPVNGGQLWFFQPPWRRRVITLLLDLNNGVICRKFSDITLESRHPIYIRSDDRHFDFFVNVAWNIVKLETSGRMSLYSLTDKWKPREKILIRSGDLEGGSFCPPPSWARTYTEKVWATAGLWSIHLISHPYAWAIMAWIYCMRIKLTLDLQVYIIIKNSVFCAPSTTSRTDKALHNQFNDIKAILKKLVLRNRLKTVVSVTARVQTNIST